MRDLFLIILIFTLFGCSAVGVPYTSDPKEKIQQAMQLIELNRPIPAKRLIQQSLTEYKNNNNEVGMAHAHRAFGILYRSSAYLQQKKFFKEMNDYDPTLEKSVENLKISIGLFDKNKEYFSASNAAWNLAGTYQHQHKKDKACAAFDLSLDFHNKGKVENPGESVSDSLPPGFSTMKDVVTTYKSNYGC